MVDIQRQIDLKIKEITDPVVANMELLMTARKRWKSDDLLRQGKLIERFDNIM